MFFTNWSFRRHPTDDAGGASTTPVTTEGDGKKDKVDEPVDRTKAFSKRLNEETAKIKAAEREAIAKENGYASYEDFRTATRNAKIKKETNIDPDADEEFKKVLDIIKGEPDPEKEDLKAKLKVIEEEEASKWEKEQLALLEKKYGAKVESLEKLDAKTKDYIAKGIDPADAYLLVHRDEIEAKKANQENDKSHIKPDPTGKNATDDKGTISNDELARFREFLPELTDEQIIAKVTALRGKK